MNAAGIVAIKPHSKGSDTSAIRLSTMNVVQKILFCTLLRLPILPHYEHPGSANSVSL